MNLIPVSEDSLVEPAQPDLPEPHLRPSPPAPGPSLRSSPPAPGPSLRPSPPAPGPSLRPSPPAPGPSLRPSPPAPRPISSSTPDKVSEATKKQASSRRSDHRIRKLKEEMERLKKGLLREKRRADRFRKTLQRLRNPKSKATSKINKLKSVRKAAATRQSVVEFLTRDENSRLLPGKKDTVTQNKVRKQRRVLTKSLKELYKEYKSNLGSEHTISYRQFGRLRPFYVTEPKASDRNTCACFDHENVKLLLDRIHQSGFIGSKSISDALVQIVCDVKKKKCMFRQCAKCCYSEIELAIPQNTGLVTWHQWQRERVCSEGKTFPHFVKRALTGKWEDLLKSFNEKLDALAKHQYIWIYQVEQCRALKNSLQDHEAVVHMDFSENYACKLNVEVQSFHYGGMMNGQYGHI
ncbi:FK506-binding protein 5-like [Alosa sapidissima]|uniref:FK506-binding protein 5-like n=1 Tax=Alosa sapidissima TaxID=34773 RepID=UPI001C0906B7|nr:FK506-binding protein 5-like [Alosa sapidissima]